MQYPNVERASLMLLVPVRDMPAPITDNPLRGISLVEGPILNIKPRINPVDSTTAFLAFSQWDVGGDSELSAADNATFVADHTMSNNATVVVLKKKFVGY